MQPAPLATAQPPLHAATDKRPSGAASRSPPLLAFSARGCTHALKLRESVKLGPQLRLELGADLLFPSGGDGSSPRSSGGAADSTDSTAPAQDAPSRSSTPDSSVEMSVRVTDAMYLPPPDVQPARLATSEGLQLAGPWAALQWQLDPEDRHKGVLRVDEHQVSFSRWFQLGCKGDFWAVQLDATLGLTYTGTPHVTLGTSGLNLPLALGLVAALLIAGKPVHVAHKEVGGLAVRFPVSLGGTWHRECLQEVVEVDMTLRREGRGLRCQLHELNGVVRLREE